MNVGRGLFRGWVLVSVIWIICAVFFGYTIVVPEIVHGNFQAVDQIRQGVDVDGNKSLLASKPFYEIVRSPSAEKLSVTFERLGRVLIKSSRRFGPNSDRRADMEYR
jgi:hypothetical protein